MCTALVFQVAEPEGVVLFLEVEALVAAVAVHAVGIDHEVESGALALQDIDQLQGILEVDVVVAGAVGDFKHHRAVGRTGLCRI